MNALYAVLSGWFCGHSKNCIKQDKQIETACTVCTVLLLILNVTQQALQGYHTCFNGKAFELASQRQHKLTTFVWHLPLQQKAGQLHVAPHKPFFRAPKWLSRFTLILERALSACCFTFQGYISFFFPAVSASVTFSSLNSVQQLCCQPQLHAVIG